MTSSAKPTGFRLLLKSKIHRATLTGKELDYEGSIALDRQLMDAADLLPGEQVHVLNVNTGSRLVTYVIEAPARAVHFNIEAIPTLVLFKHGQVAGTLVGVHAETDWTKAILTVAGTSVVDLPPNP